MLFSKVTKRKVLQMTERLIFAQKLYLDNVDDKEVENIKQKLQTTPLFCEQSVIAISHNPSDQLEIYQAGQLVQRYYVENPLYVIGIAQNYDGAVKIVQQIVTECLEKRGDCSLKEYLLCL